MEIEVLDQWACLLEPPGEACGESRRTTVRLSGFTVDDQPQAPETHTPRGLHLCPEVFDCNGIRNKTRRGLQPSFDKSEMGAGPAPGCLVRLSTCLWRYAGRRRR